MLLEQHATAPLCTSDKQTIFRNLSSITKPKLQLSVLIRCKGHPLFGPVEPVSLSLPEGGARDAPGGVPPSGTEALLTGGVHGVRQHVNEPEGEELVRLGLLQERVINPCSVGHNETALDCVRDKGGLAITGPGGGGQQEQHTQSRRRHGSESGVVGRLTEAPARPRGSLYTFPATSFQRFSPRTRPCTLYR